MGTSASAPPTNNEGHAERATYQPLLHGWWFQAFGAEEAPLPPIPIKKLPPLPNRSSEYWSEPQLGAGIVLGICTLFLAGTYGIDETFPLPWPQARHGVVTLMWAFSSIAILCVTYIFIGRAGQIRRSQSTCYPIPQEVESRLRKSESLEDLGNILGLEDSRTHGSYCVRCLVWRPPQVDPVTEKLLGGGHHCRVCQRCFRGFDHHCGVLGRCIVSGNLVCFWSVLLMLWAAVVTLCLTLFIGIAMQVIPSVTFHGPNQEHLYFTV